MEPAFKSNAAVEAKKLVSPMIVAVAFVAMLAMPGMAFAQEATDRVEEFFGNLNSLLNISSSLLLSWFTWGVTVLFWFHLNWNGRWRSSSKKLATAAFNVLIMILVFFMMIPGMYASIVSLLNVFSDPDQNVNGAFTCADNSIV
ncbi:MAG: hypothetical protein EOO81_07830 [Oxalobacteraceae bacterium]|nr:MAG: hypothetical protein EOO81_07830 [Oxalobacteraceae bacterium]